MNHESKELSIPWRPISPGIAVALTSKMYPKGCHHSTSSPFWGRSPAGKLEALVKPTRASEPRWSCSPPSLRGVGAPMAFCG